MVSVWKRVAEIVLFLVAVITLADFVWRAAPLQTFATDLNNWAVIIGAFSLGLGGYSLTMRNLRIISRRRDGWPYSIVLLVTMVIFVATGLITGSISSEQYNWIYSNIIQPVSSTMYGMNAFFIATAMYRAFKARTLQAVILLIAAIFIMLRNAPIGGVISPIIPLIGNEIWDLSTKTGMRGILIGIGIGTLALALRVIIAEEKTPLGGEAK